ncbi:MAG: NAD(P)/FAD-dependent oxidoreductase [Limisphaerales bacterium]
MNSGACWRMHTARVGSADIDTIILGAGIAGLFAARTLSDAGRRIVVFDKGRGVGGRMATRRVGDCVADHGAQYFTARDPQFRTWVERWLKEGLVNLWSDGFATSSGRLNQNGEPRYIGSRGMTSLPKSLAVGLDVTLNATAVACRWVGGWWEVAFKETEDGTEPVRARSLVLTTPVPQSLALLKTGNVTLEAEVQAALERIEYSRCLAALIQLEGASRVPPPGGLWLDGEPVGWVADNQQKGVSPKDAGACVTIHAGPRFSLAHWEDEPDSTARKLVDAVQGWLGSPVKSAQLHRWRFATPVVTHPARCLTQKGSGPMVFAGDAFAGPRVEGAALSGLAAGEAILSMKRPGAID